jgi:hypothetical protein
LPSWILILDCFANLSSTNEKLLNSSLFQFSSNLGRIAAIGQLTGGIAVAILFSFLEGRHRNALDFISATFINYFSRSFCW